MTKPPEIARAVREFSRGAVIENAPMISFTSMGVGGPADVLWIPVDEKEILQVLDRCDREGWTREALGAGTNVIVKDGGIEGLTVVIRGTLEWIEVTGKSIHAGAGASLPRVARTAARAGLSGLEFATHIPGTIGGAILTNAGAFGGSIADALVSAKVRLPNGEIENWDAQKFGFDYRSSNLPEGALILSLQLNLTEADPARIRERVGEMEKKRRTTQPAGVRSAGCVFKNPPGDSAGRLIDAAGMKGKRFGGAMISNVHANFIINAGDATANDVISLIEEAQRAVLETSGVDLIPEVRVIGRGAA